MEFFGTVTADRIGEMPDYDFSALHVLQADARGLQSGAEHPLFRSLQGLPGDMTLQAVVCVSRVLLAG